jgi:DNA-directed RNA polymerase specialized sigma24 family protein
MAEAKPLELTAEDYQRLRPVLYGALAHLTLQGFVVQPADAEDLMHDFYLHEWNNLRARYDPTRGALPNFVFVAFVRFARPRIAALHSWQSRLRDLDALGVALNEAPSASAGEAVETSPLEEAAVRQALQSLPDAERALLLRYLELGPRSERRLAREQGLTRHEVRERLVQALGRVAVAAREHPRLPADDWRVAWALWEEGRTPRAAAAQLGCTTQEVQQSRRRIFRTLTAALKPYYGRKLP